VGGWVGRYVGGWMGGYVGITFKYMGCHDFNFGLVTKAKAWKGAGQKCNLGVTFAFPRM